MFMCIRVSAKLKFEFLRAIPVSDDAYQLAHLLMFSHASSTSCACPDCLHRSMLSETSIRFAPVLVATDGSSRVTFLGVLLVHTEFGESDIVG